jgi:ATP-dependent DNA helicase RecQ
VADKQTILKQYFGYESFREGQEWLIDHILAGGDVVGVMPTGAGKSICFQVPAMLLEGITLVISPLISLMKDQVNALTQAGIKAAFINSSLTPAQYNSALNNAQNGLYKIIYVAPERLMAQDFLYFAQSAKISMVTIDEAHCISQWGQDFRPSYVKIVDFIDGLTTRPVISAFTATATAQVREDIVAALRLDDPQVLVTGFDRKNLYFEVQQPGDKFSALSEFLRDKQGKTGIIYCSTRKTVDEVCERLNEKGYRATRYHAGLPDAERKENQDDFIFDRAPIIVATNAFGMGIDKSNVSFVVHYNMPKDIESYYQEAGRAGRDGEPADCILLYNGQDVRTNTFLIENGRDTEYADRETELRLKERDRKRLKVMTYYCHTNDCLREYILKYFGESTGNYCGNCGSCNTNFENIDITIEAQKILACIARSGQRYGIKNIVDILRGSKNERFVRLGLDQLSTYNIMANDSESRIRSIINFLALNDYIRITNDEYPVAQLGGGAATVLFGGKKLEMKLPKEHEVQPGKADKKQSATVSIVNSELMGRLKRLRSSIAGEQNVPAFVIFSDAALTDMCMKRPTDDKAFLNVSGVGKVKLERYGGRFLEEIAGFIEENGGGADTVTIVTGDSELEELYRYISEHKDEIGLSNEPVSMSRFTDQLNSLIAQKYIKKLTASKAIDWLVENGYLEVALDGEGRSSKLPTEKGADLGITNEFRTGKGGQSYRTNIYGRAAQVFLLDHIEDVMRFAQEKKRK